MPCWMSSGVIPLWKISGLLKISYARFHVRFLKLDSLECTSLEGSNKEVLSGGNSGSVNFLPDDTWAVTC